MTWVDVVTRIGWKFISTPAPCRIILSLILSLTQPIVAANLLRRALTATPASRFPSRGKKSEFFGMDVPLETNKGYGAWDDEIFGGDLNLADWQVCKASGQLR